MTFYSDILGQKVMYHFWYNVPFLVHQKSPAADEKSLLFSRGVAVLGGIDNTHLAAEVYTDIYGDIRRFSVVVIVVVFVVVDGVNLGL